MYRLIIRGLLMGMFIIILGVGSLILESTVHDDLTGSVSERIEQLTDQYGRDSGFSGMVLVQEHGKILFHKAYGMAHKEKGIENTLDQLFSAGSLQKSITATAILQLAEKGRLSIDDPLSKYLSDYPQGDNIKISHLLSMSSGIPDYLDPSIVDMGKTYSREELYALIKERPLLYEPGKRFDYSNSNYALLGWIIEKVSGTAYEDFVQKNIFEPAQMEHSYLQRSDLPVALGYEEGKAAEIIDDSLLFACGSLITTSTDLYHYDRALRSHRLLSENLWGKMQEARIEKTFGLVAYGFGWYV